MQGSTEQHSAAQSTCVIAEMSAAMVGLLMKAAIMTGRVRVNSSSVAVTICACGNGKGMRASFLHATDAVSYTHLTLPTKA